MVPLENPIAVSTAGTDNENIAITEKDATEQSHERSEVSPANDAISIPQNVLITGLIIFILLIIVIVCIVIFAKKHEKTKDDSL